MSCRSSSLVDWILVTNPERIIKSGVISDCLSDHSIIYFVCEIKIPSSPPKYINNVRILMETVFFQELITINWNRFQLIPSAQDAWNFFNSEVTHVIDKYAIMKTELKVDIYPGSAHIASAFSNKGTKPEPNIDCLNTLLIGKLTDT